MMPLIQEYLMKKEAFQTKIETPLMTDYFMDRD